MRIIDGNIGAIVAGASLIVKLEVLDYDVNGIPTRVRLWLVP